MSQSTSNLADNEAVSRYRTAWAAINSLLEEGRSLSGRERHCAFLNTGGPQFADVSAASGLDLIDDGRGVALTDWDYDGKVDFWVSNRTRPWIRLLHNQSETGNGFLSVKLAGKTCHRDAIGARLELHLGGENPRVLHRSLRAGEGFVSQSGKWIHFGLGRATEVDRLIVRWPGGDEQILTGLEANRHYHITQGALNALAWMPPAPEKGWSESPLPNTKNSDHARIALATRVAFPDVSYENLEGEQVRLEKQSGPLLVNLWAAWCLPCIHEMEEWRTQASRLKDAGVDILALNVDPLGKQGKESDTGNVEKALEGWPFQAGIANSDLVETVEIVNRSLVDKAPPVPLPSSLLLDSSGAVAVVYRGPVKADQLIADVARIRDPEQDILNDALAFSGRWFSRPPDPGFSRLARNLVLFDQLEEAEAYLLKQEKDEGVFEPLLGEAYIDLATARRNRKQFQDAIEAYEKALLYSSSKERILTEIGLTLVYAGRAAEAIQHFYEVLAENPRDLTVRRLLVQVLEQTGQVRKALQHMEVLVDSSPDDPIARVYLAKGLKAQGRPAEAIVQYREALRLNPDWLVPAHELARLLCTHPNDEIRNAEEALQLAQKVDKATSHKDPVVLETLAAAYAEAERFEEAVESQELALTLEGASPGAKARLEGYRKKQPLREDPSKAKR